MSLEYLNGIGAYNIVCGGANPPCGQKPSNPEAEAFADAFEGWKTSFVKDLPNGSVVYDVAEGKTTVVHSEGMAYGLYFALLAEDRTTFDKILNGLEHYAKNENGLYSWLLSTNGSVLESHSATDADMYAAAAVSLAYTKWGDPRYQEVAQRLITRVWEREILNLEYKGYLIIKPSDHNKLFVYGDGRFVYNPSYFAPSLLRVFAAVDNNPAHDWNKVIDDGYSLLGEIINNSNRLGASGMNPVPDWVLGNIFDGKFDLYKYNRTPDQEHDAIRVYLELARDAVLSGDARSQRMADKIAEKLPVGISPGWVKLAGATNAPAVAYYGMLFLSSSYPPSVAQNYFSQLRRYYQGNHFGLTEPERSNYYFQSLLLHATALAGRLSFNLDSLKPVVKKPEEYIPYQIYTKEDGSVYVNSTLIYQYTIYHHGRSPQQRAEASAQALRQAYLDGHLRPKYLERESDPKSGSMVANYYLGLQEKPLFELFPEDLGGFSLLQEVGYGRFAGLTRTLFGASYPTSRRTWWVNFKGFIGLEKSSLELSWDNAYTRIYQNLVSSGILDFRREAEIRVDHPNPVVKKANQLVDYYILSRAERASTTTSDTRAFDDKLALRRYISAFIEQDPSTGIFTPNKYEEALFGLATILADQDGRYDILLVKDLLEKLELQIKCREARLPTGACSAENIRHLSHLPIHSLSKSKNYLEAAKKILEMIIQSQGCLFGTKGRAFREIADINVRIYEKGENTSEEAPEPVREEIDVQKDILADYLTGLEIWRDQANITGATVGNWRENPAHKEVRRRLNSSSQFYGLAQEYTHAPYKPERMLVMFKVGDHFEVAKICISLGKFYLFIHAREERSNELPFFSEPRYQGLKEAETWLKFVVEDPQDMFDKKELIPYKIEAQIRLAQVEIELGLLELSRKNLYTANSYFSKTLQYANDANKKLAVEVNRMQPEAWVNEGISMTLRNIYFNVLIGAASAQLKLAESLTDEQRSHQLIAAANSLVDTALENRDYIIFGSTKRALYRTGLWAIKAEFKAVPRFGNLTAQRLVSILKIDALTENSFGLLDLQLEALAQLAFNAFETSQNLAQAEAAFSKLFPLNQISRSLREPLGLAEVDLLAHVDQDDKPDGFKLLIQKLYQQPLVEEQIRASFRRKLK